jgi:hypothetical protein
MATMRCVEVNLGSWDGSVNGLDVIVHKALCIQQRVPGSDSWGWEYGETRPGEEFRIAYYRRFDSDEEFQAALAALRQWLGGDQHATETGCWAEGDETMPLEEV